MFGLGLAVVTASGLADVVLNAENSGKRSLRIDDFFETEDVGRPVLSPAGQAAAFTKSRPASSQLTNAVIIDQTRSDVWLQLAPGQPVRNLTQGSVDGSGWWDPRWAPDGKRLAFLSSRGGAITVWAWERGTDQIRQLSTESVEFEGGANPGGGGCRWVDAQRLLCLTVAEGEPPRTVLGNELYVGGTMEAVRAAWDRAARGERTVSVVNSRQFMRSSRRLFLIDLAAKRERFVATIAEPINNKATWWIAPDGLTLAFLLPVPAAYPTFYQEKLGHPGVLGLRMLDGRPLQLTKQLPENVLTTTVSWSPNGRELAFFAYGTSAVDPVLLYGEEGAKDVVHERVESQENPARLWRISLDSGRVEEVDTGDLDLGRALLPPKFRWTASGELLFRGRRLSARASLRQPGNSEWLILDRSGRLRALVSNPKDAAEVPDSLMTVDQGAAYVWLSKGDLWRVDAKLATARNLTASFIPTVQGFRVFGEDEPHSTIVAQAGSVTTEIDRFRRRMGIPVTGVDNYVLSTASTEIAKLPRPSASAEIADFEPKGNVAWYFAEDKQGTFLWCGPVAQAPALVLSANTFRQHIEDLPEKTVDYTSLNGETLKAKLTFPADYTPGRRYPLIVDSDIGYPSWGLTVGDELQTTFPAGLFASAGYIYMFVSMPTQTGMDEAGRANLLLFTNGVLPAVDKAIALGLADPDRLFLYGMSSFGYGVCGLITQTTRFKAAVAQSGWVDQISFAMTILRHTENPFDWLRPGALTAYSSSALPFWKNGENYRRNSPLSYVDRVRTPLMIIHGDMDNVPMSGPEVFFGALVLQRKPAQFVRYWGEAHGNKIIANFRDQFERIYAWFDDYGDIARDDSGKMIFEGDSVKSRGGMAPLSPEAYGRFSPAAPAQAPKAFSPE
jgi:dipeptidyl aminopeptidase/acylaminoacyl peptidase